MTRFNAAAKLTAVLVFSTVLLTACGGGGEDGNSGAAPVPGKNGTVELASVSLPRGQTCNMSNFAQALLAEINKARAQARNCGSTPMAAAPPIPYWNTLLTDAAVRHASDMSKNGFFSHNGSDGSTPAARSDATGYVRSGGASGSIIAKGTFSIPSVVKAWVDSPGHCTTIMEPTFAEAGAACVSGAWELNLGS